MELLCDDIILIISFKLSSISLISFYQTCLRITNLLSNDFWQAKYNQDYGMIIDNTSYSYKNLYISYRGLSIYYNNTWETISGFDVKYIAANYSNCFFATDIWDNLWYYKFPAVSQDYKQPTLTRVDNIKVKSIICSDELCVIIDSNDDIWRIQLWYISMFDCIPTDGFTRIEGFKGKQVSSWGLNTALITLDDDVFFVGRFRKYRVYPRPVQFLDMKAKQVSLNDTRVAIITLHDEIIIIDICDFPSSKSIIRPQIQAKQIVYTSSYLFFLDLDDNVRCYHSSIEYCETYDDLISLKITSPRKKITSSNVKAKRIMYSCRDVSSAIQLIDFDNQLTRAYYCFGNNSLEISTALISHSSLYNIKVHDAILSDDFALLIKRF